MMDYRKFTSFVSRFPTLILAILLTSGAVKAQENGFQPSTLAPGMTNAQGEEVVGKVSGFSAVLTLDDSSLQTLIQNGRVEVVIPHQLVNSVESVIIKRPVYFKNEKASDFADAELSGRRLVLNVDHTIIERIDYQPVELKVYETGFRSVVLNYQGGASNRELKKLGDPETDSPVLTVKLKSGNGISGRISGMKQLNIDSSLGKIEVLFERTRRIKVKPNGKLGIEMLNGDLISGKVEGNTIELINRWSTETIKLANVDELIIKRPKAQAGKAAAALRANTISPPGIFSNGSLPQQIYNARGF